jgi:glycosyltransferase involved in cell wall biosynthesis
MLREPFAKRSGHWGVHKRPVKVLMTTISQPLYKGADIILKTANILRTLTSLRFEWNVYGVKSLALVERKLGIIAKDVSVNVKGIADADEIATQLVNSDVFIHPSYIDNSPNSVCEAQLVGLPVICADSGGVRSLIDNEKTGILVASNDPYTIAHYILKICNDDHFAYELSRNSYQMAVRRHNPEKVTNDLLSIYNEIANNG